MDSGQGSALRIFAQNLWDKFFADKVRTSTSDCVRFYRATVTANPGGNRLTVQRPFDSPITLPCTDRMTNAAVGDQVMILVMGSFTNAIVFAASDLHNF